MEVKVAIAGLDLDAAVRGYIGTSRRSPSNIDLGKMELLTIDASKGGESVETQSASPTLTVAKATRGTQFV